jgi:hypothetical protein
MTREEAFTKLRRLLGPAGRVRIGRKLSSPERREAAQAAVAAIEAEMAPLLAQLRGLHARKRVVEDEASYRKFWVGTYDGFFVREKAKGDTWEEVVAELERRQVKVS